MSQTVWFFEKPTIFYCTVHDTTEFVFDPGKGMHCCHTEGCCEKQWVELTCEGTAYHDAVEYEEPHVPCEECDDTGIIISDGAWCPELHIPEGWGLAQKCDACGKYDEDLEAAEDHYGRCHEQMDDTGRLHIIVCHETYIADDNRKMLEKMKGFVPK